MQTVTLMTQHFQIEIHVFMEERSVVEVVDLYSSFVSAPAALPTVYSKRFPALLLPLR